MNRYLITTYALSFALVPASFGVFKNVPPILSVSGAVEVQDEAGWPEPVKRPVVKPKKAVDEYNPNGCNLETQWVWASDRSCHDKPKVSNPPPLETSNNYSGSLQDWLRVLRMCESGGNYQINTGNGYFGAYQFSEQTWNHWKTGYAFAHQAPPSVQDATIIKNTKAAPGGLATQNPGCYQKHGLSQFPPE